MSFLTASVARDFDHFSYSSILRFGTRPKEINRSKRKNFDSADSSASGQQNILFQSRIMETDSIIRAIAGLAGHRFFKSSLTFDCTAL